MKDKDSLFYKVLVYLKIIGQSVVTPLLKTQTILKHSTGNTLFFSITRSMIIMTSGDFRISFYKEKR